MIKVKNELEAFGFLKVVHKGYFNKVSQSGFTTRVAATDKFWSYLDKHHKITPKTARKLFRKAFLVDPIVQKKTNEKFQAEKCPKIQHKIRDLLVYSPDDIRKILNEFNKFIQTVEIKDSEGHVLPATQFTQRINHKTELITGRIYDSNLQSLRKNVRRHITLNGKPVIEIDFVSYTLAIIHAIEKVEIESGDLYTFKTLKVSRNTRKKAVNSILNTYSERSASCALYNNDKCKNSMKYNNIKAKQVFQAILTERSFLKKYAFEGVGYYLTYLDAQICLHILKNLTEQHIPVIPIHDSFIVPLTDEQKLIDAMALGFREILQSDATIWLKKPSVDDEQVSLFSV